MNPGVHLIIENDTVVNAIIGPMPDDLPPGVACVERTGDEWIGWTRVAGEFVAPPVLAETPPDPETIAAVLAYIQAQSQGTAP